MPRWFLFLLTLLLPLMAAAQGGPPMLNDDPVTLDKGRWEINLAYITQRHPLSTSSVPNIDINYGYATNFHVKFEIPWLMDSELGQGWGDASVAARYRFVNKGEGKLQMSTYPAIGFNDSRGSLHSGLVDPDLTFFVPVEVAQDFGPIGVNAEVGYLFHRDGANELVYGLCLGHEFPGGLELLAELRYSRDMGSNETQRILNFGCRCPINKNLTFLGSYGIEQGSFPAGEQPWRAYLGMQVSF